MSVSGAHSSFFIIQSLFQQWILFTLGMSYQLHTLSQLFCVKILPLLSWKSTILWYLICALLLDVVFLQFIAIWTLQLFYTLHILQRCVPSDIPVLHMFLSEYSLTHDCLHSCKFSDRPVVLRGQRWVHQCKFGGAVVLQTNFTFFHLFPFLLEVTQRSQDFLEALLTAVNVLYTDQ